MDNESHTSGGLTHFDNVIIEQYTALNNELINAKRELTKTNTELQRLSTEKNRILSIATHDLRNPLGAIQYFSDDLATRLKDKIDEDDVNTLEIIADQTRFLLSLIENLLDYARLEDGNANLEMSLENLNDLMVECVRLNQLVSSKKQINLRLLMQEESVFVQANRMKIQQTLNNLIGNAVKFSNPGGRVTVQLTAANQQAYIQIYDTGIGISEDDQQKIFEPYFKGKNKSTANEPSTGLGLSIVKLIVEQHGGKISVNSIQGEGSCFTVVLPILNSTS